MDPWPNPAVMSTLVRFFLRPNRFARRLMLMLMDGILLSSAFYVAFWLRIGFSIPIHLQDSFALLPWMLFISSSFLLLTGWYRGLTRYSASFSLYGVYPRMAIATMLLMVVTDLFGFAAPPRSFWLLFCLISASALASSRIILRDIVNLFARSDQERTFALAKRVLIYGAGHTGKLLFEELSQSRRYNVLGFVDDDLSLHGCTIQGVPIASPSRIPELIKRYGIHQILLASSRLAASERRQLIQRLSFTGLSVLAVPTFDQLADGSMSLDELKVVPIEDLLGREPSRPVLDLIYPHITSKVILVTGAGGSIGSELCRQIIVYKPSKLILLDHSEYQLYRIQQEIGSLLRHMKHNSSVSVPETVCVLGTVLDYQLIHSICVNHSVELVYHAAAYKHVPLVESNILAGIRNNVFGTKVVLEACASASVPRFVLISTDKAVRPTNVMGATKRLCELLVQTYSFHPNANSKSSMPLEDHSVGPSTATISSMVRFGNVLGSSGSVVPLFRSQLASGGPLTVTHPEVTRYFMTILEAVQLVLQSTGLAKGGDVFLLDMGSPVRIYDLARQMISLSGLTLKDDAHPGGDIEIVFTGLRPGEKLYEELLIHDSDLPTDHPLIRRAMEQHDHIDYAFVSAQLLCLEEALRLSDQQKCLQILQSLVPEASLSPVDS